MEKERDGGNLEIYLIRHGQTRNAKGDELVSAVRDFPLNNKGIKQSRALRSRFERESYVFDRVYSSPIRVAQETADHVFGKGNYVLDERLTKHDHGDWEGELKEKVYTEDVKKALESDPHNWHAPNGESQKDIEKRMCKFLEEKRGEMPYGKIAVVTHGIPTISLLRKLWNADSKNVQRIKLENTSLTRLVRDHKGNWKVLEVNDIEHLK